MLKRLREGLDDVVGGENGGLPGSEALGPGYGSRSGYHACFVQDWVDVQVSRLCASSATPLKGLVLKIRIAKQYWLA